MNTLAAPKCILATSHRKHPTDLLERLFVEERRRLKIIPQRLRRKTHPQSHVRRHDPHRQTLETVKDRRFRVASDGSRQKRTRPRIRDPDEPCQAILGGRKHRQTIQQFSDLTRSPASCGRAPPAIPTAPGCCRHASAGAPPRLILETIA